MPRRLASLSALAASAIALSVAGIASASTASWGPVETVRLYLAPPDASALDRLARSTASVGLRRARLASLSPTAAERDAVVSRARALGLDVVGSTDWVVTVRAHVGRVLALFGSARDVHRRQALGEPLPDLPAALAGLVTTALGGDETRPFARPTTCTTPTDCYATLAAYHGDDMRTAYNGDSGALPVGVAAPTIATIQFSGWAKSNLTHFALAAGLPDPVASGQYSEHVLPNGSATVPDAGGDFEVALDQEALLGIAPSADQRAYFAANTGMVDPILAVGTDAIDHPNLHIVALSISWASCEDSTKSSYFTALHNAIAFTVAAGVTIFTSSGDDGDLCDSSASGPSVNSPADDPLVVGVGGTHLPSDGGGNPLPASETGWSGSGGGQSILTSLFPRPPWQPDSSAIAGSGRLVPDIAVDGDAATGYLTYLNQGSAGEQANWFSGGGTSFAAPAATALFTNGLMTHGYPEGIGWINPALYASTATGFRDITSGNNGFAAGSGYDEVTGLGAPSWSTLIGLLLAHADPHVEAPPTSSTSPVAITVDTPTEAAGYRWGSVSVTASATSRPTCPDFAAASTSRPASVTPTSQGTNLFYVVAVESDGSCHYGLGQVFFDNTAPSIAASLARPTAAKRVISWTWSVKDPGFTNDTGIGLKRVTATLTHPGGTDFMSTSAGGSHSMSGIEGRTYTFTVTGVDGLDNTRTVTKKITVPLDDKNATPSGTWSHKQSASAFDGSYSVASAKGAKLTWKAAAKTYTVWFTTGPSCGKTAVTVGGLTKTVDLYASNTHYRQAKASFTFVSTTARTLVVKVLRTKNGSAKGFAVQTDALLLS